MQKRCASLTNSFLVWRIFSGYGGVIQEDWLKNERKYHSRDNEKERKKEEEKKKKKKRKKKKKKVTASL